MTNIFRRNHFTGLVRSELVNFLAESLRIEGINRAPTLPEIVATESFLKLDEITVNNLKALVSVYQPNAILRDKDHLNVRVGNHIAPRGGPDIVKELQNLLQDLHSKDPYDTHVAYETLHPFTDGNGRSGRTLWAWQMLGRQYGLPLGFLHQWYYQGLDRART